MNNLYFPTTIIDNFFDDPDMVVDFAKSLEYKKDPLGIWPGLRTYNLLDINPSFFHMTLNRFFNLFYKTARFYEVDMRFQKIQKQYGKGWVHMDDTMLTNIVYLTKNANSNSGTSIYKPRTVDCFMKNGDRKVDFYLGKIHDDEMYRKENNDQFEESIVVKNQYNRLLSFEGHLIHSANDFEDEERLTLIWFVTDFHPNCDKYPISKMKTTETVLQSIE